MVILGILLVVLPPRVLSPVVVLLLERQTDRYRLSTLNIKSGPAASQSTSVLQPPLQQFFLKTRGTRGSISAKKVECHCSRVALPEA